LRKAEKVKELETIEGVEKEDSSARASPDAGIPKALRYWTFPHLTVHRSLAFL
jgi:hypothetical protein